MQTNRYREEVEIFLGRVWKIRFTSNALVRLEEALRCKKDSLLKRVSRAFMIGVKVMDEIKTETGKAPEQAVHTSEVAKRIASEDLSFSLTETRALLWAGLLHEDPTLTLEAVGELMDQAPGETEQEKEDYCCQRAAFSFFLRTAPSALHGAVIEMLRREPANPKKNGNGTGLRSGEQLSTAK